MKTEFHLPQSGFRIKKLQRSCRLLLFAMVLGLLAGCVKDDLYDTPHPDKGAIVVQPDWSGISPDAIPDNYVLNVDGKEQTASGTTAVAEQLVEPGEHTLLIYNRPEGITIEGDVASVDEVTATAKAKARAAELFIQPLPGYLIALNETLHVLADDTLKIAVSPKQYVRQLELELTVTEGDVERVASVTGTLEGVERSVNLRTGERLGTAARVRTGFAHHPDKFTGRFRLVGIHPVEKQLLTVLITFTDGRTETVVSDLTEQMNGFSEANDPLQLTGNLRLPIKAGVSATITDWQSGNGDGEDVDIH